MKNSNKDIRVEPSHFEFLISSKDERSQFSGIAKDKLKGRSLQLNVDQIDEVNNCLTFLLECDNVRGMKGVTRDALKTMKLVLTAAKSNATNACIEQPFYIVNQDIPVDTQESAHFGF